MGQNSITKNLPKTLKKHIKIIQKALNLTKLYERANFLDSANILIVQLTVGFLYLSSLKYSKVSLLLLFGFSRQSFTIKFRRCNSDNDILTA
jgi:hypothetical protein